MRADQPARQSPRAGFFVREGSQGTGCLQMTPKQQRFVEEYLVDLNATQAAIRAGYSKRTAEAIGHENLKKPYIAQAVSEAMAKRSERTGITQDKVLKELARLGFSNMLDYVSVTEAGDAVVDLSRLTRDQAAAISEIIVDEYTEGRGADARNVKRIRFKLADKKGALDSIARHLGMFRDRHEVTGADGKPLLEALTVNIVHGARSSSEAG